MCLQSVHISPVSPSFFLSLSLSLVSPCLLVYLCVALSAVLADVRLEMLALLVLGDVLQERRLIHEALVAAVALVRLVGLVAPGVALEV